MRRYAEPLAVMLTIVLALPVTAAADTLNFKLLTNYSQASFRSDAPLETFVGTSALEGIQGMLTVDVGKPQDAKGGIKVDMNRVTTGIDKRDADMRGKNYLDTEVDANRWVTFEIKKVEVAGPLVPGKETPAKVHGTLTIKQKSVDRVADASVMYIKLTPEQVEQQKRFGFTADNLKVKARITTTFTDHGMQVPELLFLKLANSIVMSADLVFVRTQ
ncbi:MAG TPA: YceI family protein [Methylomirabilota bacterium]|nr:YceI family protein [Methylomirabilota bacterium]